MANQHHKEISFALKSFMDRDGLTVPTLAEKIRVSEKQVYAWLKGTSPLASNRTKLCALFECAPAHLHARPGDEVSFDRYSADELTILELEKELGDGGEVFIVTGFGPFLELEDDDLLRFVVGCIHQGTRYTYISPFPDEDESAHANEAYANLRERILDVLRQNCSSSREEMVRGFIYDPAVFGMPRGSGVFVFMFNAGEQDRPELFQFVACSPLGGNSATSNSTRRWLRIPSEEAGDAWQQLGKAVLPIVDADVEANRITSRVQQDYRKLFDSEVYLEDYKTLRQLIKPLASDHRKVKDRLFKLAQRRARQRNSYDFLRILEVGPGDFVSSHELLYSQLREKAFEFHVTGIESSSIRGELKFKLQSNAAFSNSVFEEWPPSGQQFDLILAVHSMYLIDPNNIWRMLYALHPQGSIAILHSPLQGNVYNTISHAVDDVVGTGIQNAYDGKAASQDPYRIYAEDIQAWLESDSSEIMSSTLNVNPQVDLRRIFGDEGRLTDDGKKIVDYFRGTLRNERLSSLDWQRELYGRVHEQVGKGPIVTNKETWFFLRRPQSCTRFLLKRQQG